MLTAVLSPRPAAVRALAISAAHLRLAGRDDAEAVRADDARIVPARQLDQLRHLEPRDALRDDDEQLDAVLDRLEGGVAAEGGRHRQHRAIDVMLRDRFLYRVVDRHAVDVAAAPAGRHAADDLRSVIEALAGHVHRLAAGDALDDERAVLVYKDGHARSSLME